jgi:hypothetical protein
MIEFRPNGLLPKDQEKIVGRIIMVDGNTIFQTYNRAARVLGYSGKSLEVCDLARELNSERTRSIFVDRLDREDGRGLPLQMRTVKLICDTVEEVNAIRDLQEKLDAEHTAFIRSVPGRFQDLADELALENAPKGAGL